MEPQREESAEWEKLDWGLDAEYTFVLEYFIHDVIYIHPPELIKQPALGFRFLDFPTQIVYTRAPKKLVFKCGNKCRFRMNPTYLRKGLIEIPFFVMLIDATRKQYGCGITVGSIEILASSAVNISCFTKNNDFLKLPKNGKPVHRNIVVLFDKIRNEVGKIDLTLCVSRESAIPILRAPPQIAMQSQEQIEEAPPLPTAKENFPDPNLPSSSSGAVPSKAKVNVTVADSSFPPEETKASLQPGLSMAVKKTENKHADRADPLRQPEPMRRSTGHGANPEQEKEKERQREKARKKVVTIADLAQQCYCPPSMFFQKS